MHLQYHALQHHTIAALCTCNMQLQDYAVASLCSCNSMQLQYNVLIAMHQYTIIMKTDSTVSSCNIMDQLLWNKIQLSKPSLNSTHPNSKQLKVTRIEVRHSSHLEPTPQHTTPNFSATSRPARKLKFGTDTYQTNLNKIIYLT